MILLTMFLVSTAISGVYFQYRIEHVVKNKEKKRRYGKIILSVTILSLVGSNITQFVDSSKLSKDLSDLKASNETLKVSLKMSSQDLTKVADGLKLVQGKNDSLLLSNSVLMEMISETNINVKEGFAQNQEYFESIETKKLIRKRLLTVEQKNKMTPILSTQKGKSLKIECSESDKESGQFAAQILRVFRTAGWKTRLSRVIGGYSNDTDMAELNILIKDISDYPPEVFAIFKAFQAAKLDFKVRIYLPLKRNEFKLFVSQ